MDELNRYWIGTDLKFAFRVKAKSTQELLDNFDIWLVCGTKKEQVSSENIIYDDENEQHVLLVDSTQFPSGILTMVVNARVNDGDFASGIRREVGRIELCKIKFPW